MNHSKPPDVCRWHYYMSVRQGHHLKLHHYWQKNQNIKSSSSIIHPIKIMSIYTVYCIYIWERAFTRWSKWFKLNLKINEQTIQVSVLHRWVKLNEYTFRFFTNCHFMLHISHCSLFSIILRRSDNCFKFSNTTVIYKCLRNLAAKSLSDMLKPFWAFGSITRSDAVGNCKVLCHKTSFRQKAFFL